MKYSVPLFSQRNTGRVNLSLVNWDSFQAGFRLVMPRDKLTGMRWNPWWRRRADGQPRKGQRRSIPDRRSHEKGGRRHLSEGELFQRLRLCPDRRMNRERRTGNDRRRSVSGDRVVSLAAFIRRLGNRALSDGNAVLLMRVCAALTTRETYESWKRNSGMVPFFEEIDWDEAEHRQKFTVFALTSVLDLLRPGTVNW